MKTYSSINNIFHKENKNLHISGISITRIINGKQTKNDFLKLKHFSLRCRSHQWNEQLGRARRAQKGMLKKFGGGGAFAGVADEHLFQEAEQVGRHLVDILQLGRWHITYPSHCLQRWLVEEGRLPIDHLDDHNAQ